MKKSEYSNVNVEEIMQKIREEIEKKRTVSHDKGPEGEMKTEMGHPDADLLATDSPLPCQSDKEIITGTFKNVFTGILWKYGTKYASVIKKIPGLNRLAERYYWNLAGDRKATSYTSKNVLTGILWKYGTKYASVIKKIPGLNRLAERYYWKLVGRRKAPSCTTAASSQVGKSRFGFFGVNALYEAFAKQEAQIADQKARIAEMDKIIADLDYRLSGLNRLEDALYKEITEHRREIARQRRELTDRINRQEDL